MLIDFIDSIYLYNSAYPDENLFFNEIRENTVNALWTQLNILIGHLTGGNTNVDNATLALVNEILQETANGTGTILDQIVGGLNTLIGGAQDFIGDVWNNVTGTINGFVGTAQNTVGNIIDTITGTAGTLIDDASNTVDSIIGTVTTTGSQLLSGAVDWVGGVIDTATSTVGGLIEGAGSTIGGIVGTVQQAIQDLIDDVQVGIGGLVQWVIGIPGAIAQIGDQIAAQIGQSIGGVGEGLGSFLSDPLGGILGNFFGAESADLVDRIEGIIARMENNPHTPPEIKRLTRPGLLPAIPIMGLVGTIAISSVLGQLLTTLLAPALAKMTQPEMELLRPSLVSLGDGVAAVQRNIRQGSWLYDLGAKLGFTDEDINLAQIIAERQPTIGDLADWLHRGLIDDAQFIERARGQGYTDLDAIKYHQSVAVIPGVQDLVRFAVREAFIGQSGYGGARGSGVPARFVEAAKLQGLDEEWVRSYWAAHWELPSATAGFEMLHRGLITEDQLRGLLKEQDLAPEWVENMIRLSYNPLTRVDVRRMYDLGVLDRAGVERAYLDLGYNPTHARQLTDFTILQSEDEGTTATAAERDLTRADIVGSYADGLMARSEADAMLRALGYSADESGLILDREDLRAARAARKTVREGVIDRFAAGVIDQAIVYDEMSAAGFTTAEIEGAILEARRQMAAAVARPSRADLDRFRKLGVITDQDYATELKSLGYADKWISAYMAAGSETQNA